MSHSGPSCPFFLPKDAVTREDWIAVLKYRITSHFCVKWQVNLVYNLCNATEVLCFVANFFLHPRSQAQRFPEESLWCCNGYYWDWLWLSHFILERDCFVLHMLTLTVSWSGPAAVPAPFMFGTDPYNWPEMKSSHIWKGSIVIICKMRGSSLSDLFSVMIIQGSTRRTLAEHIFVSLLPHYLGGPDCPQWRMKICPNKHSNSSLQVHPHFCKFGNVSFLQMEELNIKSRAAV